MKFYRKRFGLRGLLVFVGVCALLAWAVRVSRDSRGAALYAGWLRDGDLALRVQSAVELGGLDADSTGVLPILIRALLSDRAVPVRRQSAESLARVVSKLDDGPTILMATSALVAALQDEAPAVRAAAADGLGRIGPEPEAVELGLLRAAGDRDEWVRGAAVTALGLIEMKAGVDRTEVRPTIVAAMCDASVHVREMGIYAFWAIAEKSPELTIALLSDHDVTTRRSAVAALARNATLAARAVPELIDALTDDHAAVRAGAAQALGNIWPPPRLAVQPLTRALDDQEGGVREAAATALAAIQEPVTPVAAVPDRIR
jgi:HEAT repeat protein